jgi:hypothetical protein
VEPEQPVRPAYLQTSGSRVADSSSLQQKERQWGKLVGSKPNLSACTTSSLRWHQQYSWIWPTRATNNDMEQARLRWDAALANEQQDMAQTAASGNADSKSVRGQAQDEGRAAKACLVQVQELMWGQREADEAQSAAAAATKPAAAAAAGGVVWGSA